MLGASMTLDAPSRGQDVQERSQRGHTQGSRKSQAEKIDGSRKSQAEKIDGHQAEKFLEGLIKGQPHCMFASTLKHRAGGVTKAQGTTTNGLWRSRKHLSQSIWALTTKALRRVDVPTQSEPNQPAE